MKIFNISLFILLSFSVMYSQASKMMKNGTLQMGFQAGASIPVGSFMNYTSPSLGCAKMGATTGIDLLYFFDNGMAARLSGNYSNNAVDANKLAAGIWDENKTASIVQVSSGAYNMGDVLLGLQYQTPRFCKSLSFFIGFSGGFMFVRTPDVSQKIALSSPLNQEVMGAGNTSFCYQVQGGIQQRVTNSLALSVFADYLNANPTFNFTRNDQTNAPIQTVNQYISTINFGLKLSYTLCNKVSNSTK